ncbi:MAG: ABC transporter permease [Bdellovibrionota bacterium]
MSRKRQSLFTLLGIFLGAGGYVTISGFFVGFQNYLVDQLVNSSAHIFIQARKEYLTPHGLDSSFFTNKPYVFWTSVPAGRKDYARVEKPQSWFARLRADPKVSAYSPQMSVAALFSKAKASVSAPLVGCIPRQQAKINTIASTIVEGSFSEIGAGGNRIVMGRELMKELGAKLSQNIYVTVGAYPAVPFKIVGIFDSGNRQTDLQAFGALSDVQKVNHSLNNINEIDVRLADYQGAASTASTWAKLSPELVESWDQRNSNMFSIFATQTLMRYLIVGVVMLVAGFGIYNVLMMTVNQKMKDVAILGAMGYDAREIMTLFLSQGLILGFGGALFGVLAGYLSCRYLQTFTMPGPPGSTKAPEHLHIALDAGIYLQATLLATLSAAVSSYLPARAAAKLTPIEIIRGGAE